MRNAARVGAMFVIFVALIFGTYAALGQRLVGASRAEYKIRFADANGITPGTRVLLAGVPVGLVKRVRLDSSVYPPAAEAIIDADRDLRIPIGTKAVLPASLVGGLGDTRIDLVTPPQSSGSLASGATIPGEKAGPLDAILPNAAGTAKGLTDELTKTIRASRAVLEDEEFFRRIKSLISTLDRTTQRFAGVGTRVDTLLLNSQASLGAALRSGERTARNIEATTKELADFAQTGGIQGDVKGLFREITATTKTANSLVLEFRKLATDAELQGRLRGTLKNVETITGSGTRIAAEGEKVTASGAKIAATAEGIVTDGKEISARLITLTDKANAIAERTTVLQDQLSSILDRVGGRRKPPVNGTGGGTVPPPAGQAEEKPLPFTPRIDLLRETDPDYLRADLYLDVPLGENTIRLGLYDAFESNRLIAQYGTPLTSSLGVRYGVFAGKPAVGVDFAFGSRLSLRGDLWGLNDPRLDLRLGYRFGKGVYGYAGLDRTFGGNAPTLGLGFVR